jgi:hypothetical protein
MLLLPEDEAGQVWGPSKPKCGSATYERTFTFFRLWRLNGDRNNAGQHHMPPSAAFYIMRCVLNNEPFTATGDLKSAAPPRLLRFTV